MAGIQGIGGVPEPAPERLANARSRKREESKSAAIQDGLQISSEAQQASDVGRLIQVAKEESDIREERVEAAKQSIERGEYKNENVLREVARNLYKYLT